MIRSAPGEPRERSKSKKPILHFAERQPRRGSARYSNTHPVPSLTGFAEDSIMIGVPAGWGGNGRGGVYDPRNMGDRIAMQRDAIRYNIANVPGYLEGEVAKIRAAGGDPSRYM